MWEESAAVLRTDASHGVACAQRLMPIQGEPGSAVFRYSAGRLEHRPDGAARNARGRLRADHQCWHQPLPKPGGPLP